MTDQGLDFIVLGCGNAAGTPSIGNQWGDCDPQEPKNRRTRCSGLIRSPETTVLIDFGPDIHQQLTREEITQIDAVLLTHDHGDHVNGIDDLRTLAYRNKGPIPLYGQEKYLSRLESHRFPYAYGKNVDSDIYQAFLENKYLQDKNFTICDIPVIWFEQDHGTCFSTGYRIGDFAYSTDMRDLDEKAIETLKGIRTWVVDGGAYFSDYNPVHASINTIYRLNEKIGASQVFITHMPRHMDYRTVLRELEDGYEPAYDGLTLSVNF